MPRASGLGFLTYLPIQPLAAINAAPRHSSSELGSALGLQLISIYLSICGVAAHLKDGIPAKRVGKIFEKSSYGIIRRITPIPRHLPVVEQTC